MIEKHAFQRGVERLGLEIDSNNKIVKSVNEGNYYPRYHLKIYDANSNTIMIEIHVDIKKHEAATDPEHIKLRDEFLERLRYG